LQHWTDPSSRQRERPTSTSLQLSDTNKDLVLKPRRVLYSKTDWQTGRLTVSRTVTLNYEDWIIRQTDVVQGSRSTRTNSEILRPSLVTVEENTLVVQ
jgi:hypothetical protein